MDPPGKVVSYHFSVRVTHAYLPTYPVLERKYDTEHTRALRAVPPKRGRRKLGRGKEI